MAPYVAHEVISNPNLKVPLGRDSGKVPIPAPHGVEGILLGLCQALKVPFRHSHEVLELDQHALGGSVHTPYEVIMRHVAVQVVREQADEIMHPRHPLNLHVIQHTGGQPPPAPVPKRI